MAFEHKAGTATLFRNDKKQPGDNLPDYKGNGKDAAGNDIELAGWVKTGNDGSKFMSIKIGTPRQPAGPNAQPAATGRSHDANLPNAVEKAMPPGSDTLPF